MNMTHAIQKNKERNFLLHILRNPYGWGDDTVREIRKKSAEELERLWDFEEKVSCALKSISDEIDKATGEQA